MEMHACLWILGMITQNKFDEPKMIWLKVFWLSLERNSYYYYVAMFYSLSWLCWEYSKFDNQTCVCESQRKKLLLLNVMSGKEQDNTESNALRWFLNLSACIKWNSYFDFRFQPHTTILHQLVKSKLPLFVSRSSSIT